MHKRHKICLWSLANHKGCLRLRWGVHKGPDLSRPQTSPNDHQSLVRFSTIKFPRRRGQYILFKIHHNIGNSRTTPSLSKGQVLKSNEHTKIIDEVIYLKIEWVTQMMARERERVWAQERLVQRVFNWIEWPTKLRGRGGLFVASKRNMPIGGSKSWTCSGWGPDMSSNRLWNPALTPDMSGVWL
jgi:hypothetical protein